MELAERLKKARIEAGLTQQDLSELTGLKQEYISELESGKIKRLYSKNKERIAKILEI